MGVSGRARRAALISFVLGAVAASCALPGYEVGESSPGATASASATSGGGGSDGSTASAGGSDGSGGKGGAGGAGGEGGTGGAGGENTTPTCPAAAPEPNSPCAWPGMIECFYPTPGATCFEDLFKCEGNDPANATWAHLPKVTKPPVGCPEDCSFTCPDQPLPDGCHCRADNSAGYLCHYNKCSGVDGHVDQYGCQAPPEPGRVSIWKHNVALQCCLPGQPGQCQQCKVVKDTDGMDVGVCP